MIGSMKLTDSTVVIVLHDGEIERDLASPPDALHGALMMLATGNRPRSGWWRRNRSSANPKMSPRPAQAISAQSVTVSAAERGFALAQELAARKAPSS
jgi:hypothetical protein